MTFTAPYDLASVRSSAHQMSEQMLTLSKEGAELYQTQARIWERQTAAALESWRGIVMAQHNAALSAGRVFVDALRPEPTRTESKAA